MRRLIVFAALAVLALPASALGASRGTVLSVDAAHRTVQVVDSHHRVHAFRYRGHLAGLHRGSRIAYQVKGRTIARVRALGAATRSISFYARVIRSGRNRLVLSLGDGRNVTFSSGQLGQLPRKPARHLRPLAHIAADGGSGVTINIVGLQPGVLVLVTETIAPSGELTITITLPPAGVGSGQQASGVVSDVGRDVFVLSASDGSDLRLHMTASKLAALNLETCQTVSVTYHQDAGFLIADTVLITGGSSAGDCASNADPQDVTGTITQLSASSLTISVQGVGPETFTVDSADLLSGFSIGDVVDVTFVPGSGSGAATDVEYAEGDATGTVTAVGTDSMTIVSDDSGQPQTFSADPGAGMFDGVAVGDLVDVTYHDAAGGSVADVVEDQSGGGGD